MMLLLYIIVGVLLIAVVVWTVCHQRKLRLRAYLMQEAIRNHDFTFRMPTNGLLPGERAMQETLNQLGDIIRQQLNQSEVESWERLTRVLTHEIMNATAPITSISQSMLGRADVKGTALEPGMQAIYDTSRHLSEFVSNYRKMSRLEKPVLADVALSPLLDDVCKTYPELSWTVSLPRDIIVTADAGMLRQVLMNLTKNAVEGGCQQNGSCDDRRKWPPFSLHRQRRYAYSCREPPVALRPFLYYEAQWQRNRAFSQPSHDDTAGRHARPCHEAAGGLSCGLPSHHRR